MFVFSLLNVTVLEEDSELPCTCSVDREVTLLQWTRPDRNKTLLVYRGGKRLKDYEDPKFTDRVQLKDPSLKNRDMSLILRNVTTDDKGEYECLADYKDEHVHIESTRLIVVKQRDSTAVLEEASELPCTCSVDREVTLLQWTRPDRNKTLLVYRGGKRLKDYEDPKFTDRVQLKDPSLKNRDMSLILRNVTTDDKGKYECLADYKDEHVHRQFVHLIMIVKQRDSADTSQRPDTDDKETSTLGAGAIIGLVLGLGREREREKEERGGEREKGKKKEREQEIKRQEKKREGETEKKERNRREKERNGKEKERETGKKRERAKDRRKRERGREGETEEKERRERERERKERRERERNRREKERGKREEKLRE
ncbi:hypothetical protein WMY93_031949 [Mugilogobius chulae]|uniref:Ig-like domain-containing protein n=1 Tax=Mugilogobius chulae TaxID=88201 RepID=A0AAW0MEL3_9GOBI